MRLPSRRSACSNWISEGLLRHFIDTGRLNGVSCWTRHSARWLQILTNVLKHIIKFACHISSLNVPTVTALCTVQTPPPHCTVKSLQHRTSLYSLVCYVKFVWSVGVQHCDLTAQVFGQRDDASNFFQSANIHV